MMKYKTKYPCLLLALIVIPFIVMQVFSYLRTEHLVYMWDYKGYWMTWQEYAQMFDESLWKWLQHLRNAVRYEDYNPLSVALLYPFYHLPFSARQSYLLAISLCYLLPVIWLIAAVFKQLKNDRSCWFWLFITVAAVTYVPFWVPILRGYPDIVGLIPILAVTLFTLRHDFSKKISLLHILILGLLLWLPFGLRRWYAYTVVTLYLTLPFLNFFIFSLQEKKTLRHFTHVSLHFIGAGFISLLLACVFQWEMIVRILTTDYSHIYSAYQRGVLFSFNRVTQTIGLYLLPLFVAGVAWSFSKNKNPTKLLGIFCVVNIIIGFTLFTRTQSLGGHHMLPLALWAFFIIIIGVQWLIERIQNQLTQKVLLSLGMLTSLFVCIITFYKFSDEPVFESAILPKKSYPFRVENYGNYKKLAADLEQLTAQNQKMAILASSGEFNDDMITTLTQNRLWENLIGSSHIDLRDKLNLNSFLSPYIVVGDPPQIHLKIGQNVISIPARDILSGVGIGAAYERTADYELSSRIRATIFRKTRPFTSDEVQHFLRQFYELYPEWEELYNTPAALAYLSSDITLAGGWSVFQYNDNGTFLAHPGEDAPVRVEWDFGNIREMTATSTNPACAQADGVVITLENDKGAYQRVEVGALETVTIDITAFAHLRGQLVIDKNKNSACDSILLTMK